ncbi:cell division trigger factor [Desulfocucumis palustris]|uniref:Trigger factor n=1 Tax=Desulfocucumis palustris TaxID=1898651 RepID=A0A2L2XFX5_9FIRM|nr:trigger factor [Desulfocucumis palustris]GBF34914.1 cell division trigger factor [Desulfocucumis palustris]
MKATAERIEKNTVLLEVEVGQEQFSNAIEKAYRKLVTKINVPGFRKGKAPKVILERYIGKQAIVDEAMEIVLPEAYMKAVEDTGIEPVSQPELEMVQAEEGKPVVFKAKVVVKPEVKLGQYTGLQVTKPSDAVSEEDIQNELDRLQNRHAKLLTLEEGTVEDKDLVTIDFEGKIEGVPFEGGQSNDYTLEIGSGTFIPGFEEQLVGIKLGETKDISVKFPEDYGREDLSGKDAVFTVTAKVIKRKELSPLDDEFAKDVSEFDTLEELRADLANKLKKTAEEKASSQVRAAVLEKAVEGAEIDMPPEMIDGRVEEMLGNMEQRLMSQGVSMENYLKYTNSNVDDMKENLRPDAEKNLKQTLVIDAVAKAEDIQLTDEDIDREINRMSEEMKQDAEVIKKIIEGQGQMDYIKKSIIRDKTIQFMLDKAVVTEGTIEAAGE